MRNEKKRREQERKEQKFNLFSWAEDQRTQWDIVNAWRPSGPTSAGAFTKFEAMDWSERQDQLWRVAKFFIDRGLWLPGKNGALSETQMQEILKMEAGWISAVSGASDGFGKFEYMSWAADVQGSLAGQKGPAWGSGGGGSRNAQGSAWEPGPEEVRASTPTSLHRRPAAASHPALPERRPGEPQEDGKQSPSLRPQRSFVPRKDPPEVRTATRQPRDPRDTLSPVAREEAGLRSPGAIAKLDRAGSRSGPQRSPPEEMSLEPVSGTRPPRDHKHALEKRAASRQSQRQPAGRQDRADSKAETAAPPSPARMPPPGAVRSAAVNAHANKASQKLGMDSALDAEQADYPSHLEHNDHAILRKAPRMEDFLSQEDSPSGSPRSDGAAATNNCSPRLNPSPRGAQHEGGAPAAVTSLARSNRSVRVASASSASSSSGSEMMSPSGFGRHRLPSLDSSQQHGPASDEGRSSADSEEFNDQQQQPRRRQVTIRTTSLLPTDRAQARDQGTPGSAHSTSWMLQIQGDSAGAAAPRQGHGSSGSSTPSQNFYSPRSSAGDQVQVPDEAPWPQYSGRNDHPQDSNLALVTGRSIQTAHARYGSPEARRRGSSHRPTKADASKSSPSTPGNSTSQHTRGWFELPGSSPKRSGTTAGCGVDMHIPLKDLSIFQDNERQKSLSTSRQNTLGRQQQQQPVSRGGFPGKDLRNADAVFGTRVIRGKAPTMKTAPSSPASRDTVSPPPLVVREWQPYVHRSHQQVPHHQPGPVTSSAAAKRAWWQPERTSPVRYSRPPVFGARTPLDKAVRGAVYRSASYSSASPQPEPRINGNIRHMVLLREKPASVALSEHRRRMGL